MTRGGKRSGCESARYVKTCPTRLIASPLRSSHADVKDYLLAALSGAAVHSKAMAARLSQTGYPYGVSPTHSQRREVTGISGSIPIARSIHLYDRNRRRPRVVNDVMRSTNFDTEDALRRLLVNLERPALLKQWRRPKDAVKDRQVLPKGA